MSTADSVSAASGLAIPAFAALAAACAFGTAAALQHQQAGLAPHSRGLRLLADVARRPLWLAGFALAVSAYGLQALALAFGPLTLVAPIVAADLLVALPLAARWSRRPLRPRDWGGCLLVATGVAVFLAAAPPSAERREVPAGDWFAVLGTVAAITVIAVVAGRVTGRAFRAGMLAVAAGVVFGLTAAVTASFTRSLRHEGLLSVLAHWQPWALISLGLAGILLSTSAFQAGALSASLPIMDTVEPVSGVVIGAVLFGERLAASPAGLAVQLGAAVAAVAGIAVLGPSLAAVQAAAAPGTPRAPGAAGTAAASAAEAPVPPPAPAPAAAQAGCDARTRGATRPRQPGRPHRPRQLRAECDLLRVGCDTTNAEDRADQLRS